eukprot:229897-Chlamydomonas_euryale.AAC.8
MQPTATQSAVSAAEICNLWICQRGHLRSLQTESGGSWELSIVGCRVITVQRGKLAAISYLQTAWSDQQTPTGMPSMSNTQRVQTQAVKHYNGAV